MSNPTASVIDVYDTIADSYVQQYAGESADTPHVDIFLSKLQSKSRILDAGCGAGRDTAYMAGKGFSVTGIDLSQKMLAIAKCTYPNCTFLTIDIASISFPNDSFEGIISSYSLIHIPDEKIPSVLSRFHQILTKGGWLTIFAQQGESDHYIDEPFAPGKKTFFNFFTPEGITETLTKAGFSSISIQSEHCNDPYNMSDTNLYILAKK